MTKALFRLFILFITCSTAISCSEQDSPELPDNPGNTNQGIASIDQTQINGNGGGFIIRVKVDGIWQASSSETWCTLSRASGNGNGSISGYMKANTGAERSVIITITSGKEEAQFTLKQLAGDSSNPDPDPDPEKPSGYAGRIEIPKLKGGSMNQFITHTTNIEGKEIITYSMEYDYSKKHARWVAFTFDSKTKISNVSRTDAWMYDKKIPEEYRTYEKDYKEYSRGHLCASYDRTYSLEANKQTFYYSNMSRIARGYLTDSYLSESIVEDLVYSLWENRSKITINTSLKNYLFRSVANKCINYLQLEYVRRETACSSEDLVIYSDLWSLGENPVEHLEGKELHSIIQKTIDGLSPETRKVFLLSRFENKRQEEIAEIMGITIHTVKYHMRSALDKLKEAAKSYLALIVMFITNIFN